MSEIPSIETGRLRLRGGREDDFETYDAIFRDPEVARFIAKLPSPTEAWRSMAAVAGHWALRGYGPWAVERKSDGALIGRIGFWYPAGWPALELIWAVAASEWGKGYASEGGRAAMDYGFEHLRLPQVTSHIDPENFRSQAVARRLGQRPGETVDISIGQERFPVVAWEISRQELSKSRIPA